MRLAATLLLVLLAGGAAGQGGPVRWAVEIRGPAVLERGELRLDGRSGQILLASADSTFQGLPDLRIDGDSLTFTVPGDRRRFAGTMRDSVIEGTARTRDGAIEQWTAVRLIPGSTYYPVEPRIMVRQVVIGGDSGSERVPGAWVAALPDSSRLDAEYHALARAADLPAVTPSAVDLRPRRLALGLDPAWRVAERALLSRIGSRTTDAVFDRVFNPPRGAPRTDLFDVAIERAAHLDPEFRLADAVHGLAMFGETTVRLTDSAAIREAAWLCWSRIARDSATTIHQLDEWKRRDPVAAMALHAVLLGFDDAVKWWREAVHWLLTQPWIDTPAGPRSPAQLVAAFWGTDSLPLPDIVTEPYGDFQAFPALGAARLGAHLVRPLNATARESIAATGVGPVLYAWSLFGESWGEPLAVVSGGTTRYAMSPRIMSHTHSGTFVADRDLIRIDPGITPVLAVSIIVHEWQHLIIAGRRLDGAAPGVIDEPMELRLRADDPWLAEGAAEWATEEALRPARASVPMLALFDAEKRRELAATTPDDPHALGYRLVRAAAERTRNRALIQGRLVRLLHDLPAFAVASGLAGPSRTPSIALTRPTSTAVIPEITFMWYHGVADQVTRRLIVPTSRPEH